VNLQRRRAKPEYTLRFEDAGAVWRLKEITGKGLTLKKAEQSMGTCAWPAQGSLGNTSFFDEDGTPRQTQVKSTAGP
jgi:hypothetical protein